MKKNNINKQTRKRRIKYKNVLLFIVILILIGGFGIFISNLSISNIYITNNRYLSDQEIMEYVHINNYPKSYTVSAFSLKKKLIKHPLIISAKVTKKMFTSIYIEVEENYPLFYYSHLNKTVLLNGTLYEEHFNAPMVINYVPDTVYDLFITNMALVYPEILERISEIKYDPNDVDEERFLLLMKDKNYVYLTLSKFTSINNYLDIVKKFGNKKGILYLDSGEYFEILEG